MLTRLYIDNIRSFSNFEFKPGRVAVLVGPNGGGKSSVFRVLSALQEFLVGGQEVTLVFGGSRTHWGDRLEQRVELDVTAPNGVAYSYTLTITNSADDKLSGVKHEQLSANGKIIYRVIDAEVQLFGDKPKAEPRTRFPFNASRSFLPLLEERPDNQLIMEFRRWMAGVWLFSPRPQVMALSSDREDPALSPDATNFVSWYRVLAQEQPQIREALLRDLASVIPGLSEIRLLGASGSRTRVMVLECKGPGASRPYLLNLSELSDGQRVLLVLYTVKHMLAQRGSLLMFDEPDNYVAFQEIQPWLAGLRDAVVDAANATLLVISHHSEVIDYLAPDQVLKLWRDEGPTRLEEPTIDLSTGILASEATRME